MRQLKITKQITNKDAASLDLYLNDISKIGLLLIEDEVILAQKIRNGDRKALKMLITSNLRFVISVAKQYQNQGLSLSDLINEGNLGLIKAAERFDESRGFKFISYAVWWIRQSILQALAEHSRIVRLPLKNIASISKINTAFIKLEQIYQREPVPEEIADMLKFQIKVVKEAFQLTHYRISIDAPFRHGDHDEITLCDILPGNGEFSPDTALIDNSLTIEINRILASLDDLEAEVIRHYFGLDGKNQLFIDEIAAEMKITHQVVRRLKDKAIKKLQDNYKKRLLRQFLG